MILPLDHSPEDAPARWRPAVGRSSSCGGWPSGRPSTASSDPTPKAYIVHLVSTLVQYPGHLAAYVHTMAMQKCKCIYISPLEWFLENWRPPPPHIMYLSASPWYSTFIQSIIEIFVCDISTYIEHYCIWGLIGGGSCSLIFVRWRQVSWVTLLFDFSSVYLSIVMIP